MIDEAIILSERLAALSQAIQAIGKRLDPDAQGRYFRSSAELVHREAEKLARATESSDPQTTAWALRSVADMMKGLIDIGADISGIAPMLWQDAKDLARQAHELELVARQS